MKKKSKSGFASDIEEIAKKLISLVENDRKKSVILIATESVNEDTATGIAFAGLVGEMAKGIADFATSEESRSTFVKGIELARTKLMFQTIEKLTGRDIPNSLEK